MCDGIAARAHYELRGGGPGRLSSVVAEGGVLLCIDAGGVSGLRGCKYAVRKWHMRRCVDRCGSGTGRVR